MTWKPGIGREYNLRVFLPKNVKWKEFLEELQPIFEKHEACGFWR